MRHRSKRQKKKLLKRAVAVMLNNDYFVSILQNLHDRKSNEATINHSTEHPPRDLLSG